MIFKFVTGERIYSLHRNSCILNIIHRTLEFSRMVKDITLQLVKEAALNLCIEIRIGINVSRNHINTIPKVQERIRFIMADLTSNDTLKACTDIVN